MYAWRSFAHGAIETTASDHDGETTHEGLGIGGWDVTDCRFSETK